MTFSEGEQDQDNARPNGSTVAVVRWTKLATACECASIELTMHFAGKRVSCETRSIYQFISPPFTVSAVIRTVLSVQFVFQRKVDHVQYGVDVGCLR
ncbi:hypothetical protein Pla52n_07440 [Stieleria varia]|uniref:Uncharacterized protein n=1 Tax=Stieleria varia TaxID=2528005 RepID=A0A5C6B943_9BACT|nr:hypothetical protein Pla52n_07440 [Stieleria varia]